MIGGVILLVGFILIAQSTGAPTDSLYPDRIVGGSPASSATEFPYQASIRYNGRHICGGAIISSTKILTAAHCIPSTQPALFNVRVGALYRSKTETTSQILRVSKLDKHPQYSAGKTQNDIAIITLSTPLKFNTAVKAIALATTGSSYSAGTIVTATGWGTTSIGGGGPSSDVLRKVDVPIVSRTTCRASYGTNTITNLMLCAGSNGKDTCQGDSGGPLASKDVKTLIGITSFGIGCGNNGFPGVYTDVSKYRPWIQTNAGV